MFIRVQHHFDRRHKNSILTKNFSYIRYLPFLNVKGMQKFRAGRLYLQMLERGQPNRSNKHLVFQLQLKVIKRNS